MLVAYIKFIILFIATYFYLDEKKSIEKTGNLAVYIDHSVFCLDLSSLCECNAYICFYV